ncbi:MAG: alternative ribosome rescue aminoacyl-tRNA hydrolase ArfB [Phycisphaerales bacterium]
MSSDPEPQQFPGRATAPSGAGGGARPGTYPPVRPDARADARPGAAPDGHEPPPSAIDLGGGAWIARGDVHWSFSRASGPGGQNVNKVNTRAELRVPIAAVRRLHPAAAQRLRGLAGGRLSAADEIVVAAEETRSQQDNREACLDRVRGLVARAQVVPKMRKKTKPTRGSKERRLEGKKREAKRKSDRRVRED